MKKLILLFILLLLFALLVFGGFYYRAKMTKYQDSNQAENILPDISNDNTTGQTLPEQNKDKIQNGSEAPLKIATVVPPINRFNERATKNFFGSHYSSFNKQNLDTNVCRRATAYTGYHTGIDLEIFPDELNADVPVLAIADGTVRQIRSVTGYGGLIVIEHKINGATYTAYYGHIDLSSSSLKTGEQVNSGQKVANLAPQCSSKNGFNRKHLHLGLRKGSSIVVSGYVANMNELNNWIDVKTLIK